MRAVSILVVLVAILVGVGCGEQKVVQNTKQKVEYKVIDAKRLVKRGGLEYEVNSEEPFTGKIIGYYPNGQQEAECEFRAGKEHGKVVMWYENGQNKLECEFRAGQLHGKVIGWYETGQKEAEGEFLDGKQISGKRWDKGGKRISRKEWDESQ